jgi:hypothetical protein
LTNKATSPKEMALDRSQTSDAPPAEINMIRQPGAALVLASSGVSFSQVMRWRGFWLGLSAILLWSVATRLAVNAHTYFDAEDALGYAVNVRARHFALFDAAGSGWQLLCTAIDALLPHSAEGTAAGKLVARAAGTIIPPLLYATLVLTTGRVALPLAMAFFFSASFCPWWYSLQPDKYVPQLAALAIALTLLMTRQRPPSRRFLVTLGLVFFAAVIVHTDSGLICLSIMPLLYRTMRLHGILPALRQGLLAAGVMFAALAVYYTLLLIIFIKPGSIMAGLQWMMSYMVVAGDPTGWGNWNAKSLALAFVGIARSVFTTEFAFGIPAIASRVGAMFPDKILIEEQWLGAQFPLWFLEIGIALLACAVVAVCAVLCAGALAIINLVRDQRPTNWYAITTVLFYLVPATIFFDWWEPINNEFWISPWYAVTLFVGIAIASKDWRFAAPGVATAAVVLAVLNGLFGVYPRLDARADYWLMRQQPLARIATRDDLIVENGFMAENYVEYLSEAHVIRADSRGATPETIVQSLKEALDSMPNPGSVYLTDLVTDTTSTSNPLHIAISNGETIERFVNELPPPTEWISIDGRRLARYDAQMLRAYLAHK